MRTIVTAALSVALMAGAREAAACRCRPDSPGFWENAREAKGVVVAEVTRYLPPDRFGMPAGFEANVKAVVKGADMRKSIVFRTDGLSCCGVFAGEFPIGTLWAFVLRPQDPQGDLGMCESRWMPVLREKLPVRVDHLFTTEQLRARLARDRKRD